MAELMPLLLFVCICLALMAGYPVALTLGGMSLLFAGIGMLTGTFDGSYLGALPNRLFGIMNNQTMLAVPLRSEEHTSELQSLMRISYAVFCYNKKQPSSHRH